MCPLVGDVVSHGLIEKSKSLDQRLAASTWDQGKYLPYSFKYPACFTVAFTTGDECGFVSTSVSYEWVSRASPIGREALTWSHFRTVKMEGKEAAMWVTRPGRPTCWFLPGPSCRLLMSRAALVFPRGVNWTYQIRCVWKQTCSFSLTLSGRRALGWPLWLHTCVTSFLEYEWDLWSAFML